MQESRERPVDEVSQEVSQRMRNYIELERVLRGVKKVLFLTSLDGTTKVGSLFAFSQWIFGKKVQTNNDEPLHEPFENPEKESIFSIFGEHFLQILQVEYGVIIAFSLKEWEGIGKLRKI